MSQDNIDGTERVVEKPLADPADNQRVLGKYGVNEIISSSVLFFNIGERNVIYPFTEDREYGVGVRIELTENEGDLGKSKIILLDDSITVEIRRGFQFGQPTGHTELIIAQTEVHNFFLTLVVSFIGTKEINLARVEYNVLRRSR